MKKILVADDDPDIRLLMEIQVSLMGHEVVAVSDGVEALDELSKSDFDLAVLDVSMPRMTGLEVTAQVRAVDPDHGLPIILLSAYSAPSDVRRGIDAGADLYLTKPLSMLDLRNSIRKFLFSSDG